MKTLLLAVLAAGSCLGANAESLRVKAFDYYGPYKVNVPFAVDSLDAKGTPFAQASLPKAPERLNPTGNRMRVTPVTAPSENYPSLHVLSFTVDNSSYITPVLEIEGIDNYNVYVDGKKSASNTLALKPATHRVDIRYSTVKPSADSLKVMLKGEKLSSVSLRNDGTRSYSLLDVLHGPRVSSVDISPDGRFLITGYTNTADGGNVTRTWRVTSLADGRIIAEQPYKLSWMPSGSSYIMNVPTIESQQLVAVDAATGTRRIICGDLTEYPAAIAPDGSFAVVYQGMEGRTEDPQIYQILEPEDRQPGWRYRNSLALLDFATGQVTPVTFGHRNTYLNDISPDSKRLLIYVSNSRLEKRPTTVTSIIDLDLATMKADTLVVEDGFIGRALYSPDGKTVLVSGNPECLGGIGKNVPEGRTPSMTDMQLYTIDIASHKVTPLTKDFNPNVENFAWSRADGQIYLTAEDRDCVNMFRINPATGKTTRIVLPEELVKGISLPNSGRTMAWFGESAASPNALYTLDTKTLKSTKLDSPNAPYLADVKFGSVEGWDFVNSRGDTINGRFYLPADFDPSKKYPMIVNYYGGCSPTSRNFESRYPHHAYAAQGYVVYVINPSGATGFGQEFSSRHVNTAGEGVAQDIIEGTKEFLKQHPYVDETKIGCIGASYGGFMTQYLQTVTDLFAAAISHAGISDHTSYWGEGYWGYSYSEVSMANSYPWSDQDLYVKQSPLYRADKVNTPILFLHGDHDNNVPFGESIQMFTALKLLGKPTAFVAVTDQDHQILDYEKRQKWQDTIFAWFSKYLKGDDAWWEALYPSTPL